MTETLAAFIARRTKELDDEELPLRQRMEQIKAERDQLRRASLAAGIEADAFAGSEKPKRGRRPRSGTIKTVVISILTEAARPMAASELLHRLNEAQGTTLIRSSLSPQLSRLKQEGLIKLTDGYWHMPGVVVSANENAGDSLFPNGSPALSDRVPEAQDGKAPSGGGT